MSQRNNTHGEIHENLTKRKKTKTPCALLYESKSSRLSHKTERYLREELFGHATPLVDDRPMVGMGDVGSFPIKSS